MSEKHTQLHTHLTLLSSTKSLMTAKNFTIVASLTKPSQLVVVYITSVSLSFTFLCRFWTVSITGNNRGSTCHSNIQAQSRRKALSSYEHSSSDLCGNVLFDKYSYSYWGFHSNMIWKAWRRTFTSGTWTWMRTAKKLHLLKTCQRPKVSPFIHWLMDIYIHRHG